MSQPLPDSPQHVLHNEEQLETPLSSPGAFSAPLSSSLLDLSEASQDTEDEGAESGSDTESDEMTLTKQQKEAVAADKMTQVECELRLVTRYSTGEGAQQVSSARNLKNALDRIPPLLLQLEAATISVINTKVGDAKLTAMDDWAQFRDDTEEAVRVGLGKYHNMPGALPAAADPAAQEAAVIKSALTEKVAQIKDDITNFGTALTDMITGDRQLTKIQYITMNTQLMEIKQRIDPGLDNLNQQLVRADPTNGGTYHTELSAHLKSVLEPFTAARTKFISNVPDESFTAAAAGLNDSGAGPNTSTPNSSFVVGNTGTVPRVSNQLTHYKYKERDPPTFYGDEAQYAMWKREWQTAVCLGRDDSWICRNIILHIKVEDQSIIRTLGFKKTAKEVWKYLDSIYAKSTTVARKVVRKFQELKFSDLGNGTPQLQLVNLDVEIQDLHQKLEAVGKERMLTENFSLITHAIDLMPTMFQNLFCVQWKKEEREAEAKGEDFDSKEIYDLVMKFNEDMVSQFRELQPHTLVKKSKAPPDPPNRDRDRRAPRKEQSNHYGQGGQEDDYGDDHGGAVGGAGGVQTNAVQEEDQFKHIKEQWAKLGKCPIPSCGKDGHFWRGRDNKPKFSASLADCATYRRLALEERVKFFKDLGLCRRCLSRTHRVKDCKLTTQQFSCGHGRKDNNRCGQDHHTLLHGGGIRSNHRQSHGLGISPGFPGDVVSQDVMLAIVKLVITGKISTCCLLDGGSTCSIITHALAELLGLKPKWIWQTVELCGRAPEKIRVAIYAVKITTGDSTFTMRLVGMDKITSNPGKYNLDFAYKVFPQYKRPALDKPEGEVQMLIGADQVRFLPGGGFGRDLYQNLRVFTIPVAPYKVLMGSHPEISFLNPVLTEDAISMRTAVFITTEDFSLPGPVCLNSVNVPADFPEAETLGYDTPRKCNRCATCHNCHINEEGITLKEQLEMQMLRKAVSYDPVARKVTVEYPVVGDITQFKDNRQQAMVRCEALIKSLQKRGLYDKYTEVIKDFISRGVWEKTTLQEIEDWKEQGGHIHYVSHHPVLNPSSQSTPVRCVVDSALRNNYTGPPLSSLYAKGPNCVSNLFQVLVAWRCFEHGGTFDISKAYHQMKTTRKEFFMRLVVWKDILNDVWEIYGHTVVGFGDVSASALLESTLERLADLGKAIDELLCKLLLILRYVDDQLLGGTREQLKKMMGNLTKTAEGKFLYDGTIAQVLDLMSMAAKLICLSGETDPDVLAKQGPVLGLDWQPTQDLFSFKLTVNVTKKVGAGRAGPNLTLETFEAQPIQFTRRLCLQVASQVWDPLGLLTPFSIRLKILMKELVEHEKAWDEVLPEVFQEKWTKMVREMLGFPALTFPRSVTSSEAVGRPELIAFFDGSDHAFGAVIYVRWVSSIPDQYVVRIVTSKARVTPRGGTTTPRSELSGMVIAVRLVSKVFRAMTKVLKPVRVTVSGDSKCSVTAVDTNAASLNPFFANRALEVHGLLTDIAPYTELDAVQEIPQDRLANMDPEEVVVDKVNYLPGPRNFADYPTRGNLTWKQIQDIWQEGPDFMLLPRPAWPLSRDFVPTLPAEERRKRYLEASVLNVYNVLASINAFESELSSHFPANFFNGVRGVLEKYDEIRMCRAVIARVCRACRLDNNREAVRDVENRDLAEADWFMAFVSQNDTVKEILSKRNYDSLAVFFRGGLARAKGRVGQKAMQASLGHSDLILLTRHCRLAYLVMRAAHCEDHRLGAGDALFRSVKQGYWIVQGRRLAERIVKDCPLCIRARAATVQQRMGDLPDLIFEVPVRPFSHIALDFAGAMMVRDEVKGRVSKKCFPLIFVCLNTSATHIALASGYSTEQFLVQLAHFFAIRGRARFIYCDQGSQLKAASKGVSEPDIGQPPSYKWSEIRARTSSLGTEWKHCPTQAQWRDGKSEATVKAMKRTLKHLNPGGDLTYSEVQCLLAKAANIINERPLGIRQHGKGSPDFCVITPNLLLQGSRTCQAPGHEDNFEKMMFSLTLRLEYVEKCFSSWWSLWLTSVFPSLVPFRKWKTAHRNVAVGDLVQVMYSSKLIKPVYRMGLVSAVMYDDSRPPLVRTVKVQVRPQSKADRGKPYVSKVLEELVVPVQRLVVLCAIEDREKLPKADANHHTCSQQVVPGFPSSAWEDDDDNHSSPAQSGPPTTSSARSDSSDIPEPGPAITEAPMLALNYGRFATGSSCWQCSHRQQQRLEWSSSPLPPTEGSSQ